MFGGIDESLAGEAEAPDDNTRDNAPGMRDNDSLSKFHAFLARELINIRRRITLILALSPRASAN